MTKKQMLQKAYSHAVKLYKAQVRRMTARGYRVHSELPAKPKTLTEASVRRVQKEQQSLYEKSELITEEGEVISGKRARVRTRWKAAEKAKKTRERKAWRKELEEAAEKDRQAREEEYERRRQEREKRREEKREERRKRKEWEKERRRLDEEQKRMLMGDAEYEAKFGNAVIGRQWIEGTISNIEQSGFNQSADKIRGIIQKSIDKVAEEMYERNVDTILSTGEALTDAELQAIRQKSIEQAKDIVYASLAENQNEGTIALLEVEASAYNPEGARFQRACTSLYTMMTGSIPSAQEMQGFAEATENDIGWTDVE